MRIIELKYKIEKKFKRIKLGNDCFGFQNQPNTKFLKGISNKEIDQLEILFGFDFPTVYREMLLLFKGFDTPEISINPDDNNEIMFEDFFYQYPKDIEKSQWLINDINEFYSEVESVLKESGFDVSKIIGFLPIYYCQVLVVFKDKKLSPVISVWGADIILYGNNLNEYLKNKFLR